MAQKEDSESSKKSKKPNGYHYDDEKIENMLRYYNLGQNYESLLRYIKHRGLVRGDDEFQ